MNTETEKRASYYKDYEPYKELLRMAMRLLDHHPSLDHLDDCPCSECEAFDYICARGEALVRTLAERAEKK